MTREPLGASVRPQARVTLGLARAECMFFFSSRRRHTRLQGDWSSDVCSSDLRTVARESGALVGDLPTEHDRIHPLAIGDLCQGAQGIGPLERGIAAGNVVAPMERLCVLSRSFRLLQQGPSGSVARPQSLRSKFDLLTKALAQEVCHPARQAVSCEQEISHGLLEAGPLVVRTARAVDESH